MRVLFVCLGNICRSPTAEAVFRAKASAAGRGDIESDSCGTAAYHAGEPPDRRSQRAAQTRGYKMSDLRARGVTTSDFHDFDLLLAMDENNLDDLLEQAPPGTEGRVRLFLDYGTDLDTKAVPDPYYGDGDGFEQVLDLVENASDGLLRAI